jgi:hypothetical protein
MASCEVCDRSGRFYAGRIVEQGPGDVLTDDAPLYEGLSFAAEDKKPAGDAKRQGPHADPTNLPLLRFPLPMHYCDGGCLLSQPALRTSAIRIPFAAWRMNGGFISKGGEVMPETFSRY